MEKEKGELMSRIERRWRLGVLAGMMALLTAAIVAGAGQSAPSAQGGTIVAGTTDTVTNLDPAGNYDYGSATLGYNIYEHLYDARNGAKLVPSLATGCAPVGTAKTWR
jgi:peptide/nickel transport system substrate-binding protein